MRPGWTTLSFAEAFDDLSGGHPKTKAGDYQPHGELPIVDQGQALIGGYTDDPSAACTAPLPVIAFGDHTRSVKFIDFPFGVGADGLKVLKPRPSLDDRFAFHFLSSVRLPAAGYDRHFKYLKRISVPAPPLEEQQRIAAILDKADDLLAKRRAAIAHLDSLTQAIFDEMFGTLLRGDEVPVELESLTAPERPICYGILKPGPDLPAGRPYVRVVDIQEGRIRHEQVRRTSDAIDDQYRRSRLREGDLLMSIRGHVGRLAIVPPELDGANITQDSARVAVVNSQPRYVLEHLRSPLTQEWMRRNTKGAAVRGLNIGDLKRVPIFVPPRQLQDDFAASSSHVDAMQLECREALTQVEALCAGLQARAFRGEL